MLFACIKMSLKIFFPLVLFWDLSPSLSLSLPLSLSKKKTMGACVCIKFSTNKKWKIFSNKKKILFSIDKAKLLHWPTFSYYQTWRTFSIKTNTSYYHSLSLSLKQANINILSEYLSKTQQGHSRDIIMIWFQFI